MAGPTTEILDSDLKDLRADFHRLEVGVANSIATSERSVIASITRVELAQAKQEAVLGVFRAIVLGTAGAAITGILTTVWSAGATSSKINALQSQVDRIEVSLKSQADRLEASLQSQIGRLENRLDRIESSINRLTPPTETPRTGIPGK